MPTLLQLDCSADPTTSRSRELTRVFADAWRRRGDGWVVRHRDLHADPLPHLESSALHWPVGDAEAAGLAPEAVTRQQQVIEELLAADALVIGLPLYNYSVPSTLKTWLDRVHVPGVLAPTGSAPTQPLRGRPVVVATTRGGAYDPGTRTADWDHATPVLRILLGEALGMDVHVVSASLTLAERVPDMAEQLDRSRAEMAAARTELERLAGALSV